MKREDEGRKEGEDFKMMDNIPFHVLNWGVYVKLATKLDPDSVIGGNNWRMLAEKLSYTTEEIFAFDSQQSSHGRNTIKVLQAYSQKQKSTVNELYSALEAIDRPDALDELKAVIPDIERQYKETLQRKHAHSDLQVENDWRCHSCDEIPGKSLAYCSSIHHKKMMQQMPKYPPSHMTNNHQIAMSTADKIAYHRHKSQEPQSRIDGMRPHYEHPSPEFKRQRSAPLTDSMMVHGRDNRSQYYRDVEPMDHSPSVREEGVPPAIAMMRGMSRYDGHSSSMMMPPASCTNEKNFKCPYRPGLKLEMPNPSDHFGQMRNDFISPGVTPTTPSTPLGHLTELAYQRPFQPEEGYTDLMRMKHLEEMSQSKTAHFISQTYDNHNKSSSQCSGSGSRCNEEGATTRHKNDPPNTFPLRLKSNSCSSSSSTSMSTSQLVKSVSLPHDMKPAEFRKAFRHIKVFVTHAVDDKRHTQRVINLCTCLDKNGFTVCVDIFQRKLKVEDRSDWYQKRFQEADFIIVVISQKYWKEVDSCELENDADVSDSIDSDGETENEARPHCLHTKHIYRLMYKEFMLNGHGSKRFVPLLFQGVSPTLIPPWMLRAYSKLVYNWPEQYKDLLWMLTKPGNRVPENVVPSSDVEMYQTNDDSADTNDLSDGSADRDRESIP